MSINESSHVNINHVPEIEEDVENARENENCCLHGGSINMLSINQGVVSGVTRGFADFSKDDNNSAEKSNQFLNKKRENNKKPKRTRSNKKQAFTDLTIECFYDKEQTNHENTTLEDSDCMKTNQETDSTACQIKETIIKPKIIDDDSGIQVVINNSGSEKNSEMHQIERDTFGNKFELNRSIDSSNSESDSDEVSNFSAKSMKKKKKKKMVKVCKKLEKKKDNVFGKKRPRKLKSNNNLTLNQDEDDPHNNQALNMLNHVEISSTPKGSFKCKDEVEYIGGIVLVKNACLHFEVFWKIRIDGVTPKPSIVTNKVLQKECPGMLLDFYENRLRF